MQPKTLKVYDHEYKNLLAVAAVLQATSKNKARYLVEDVYFDLGQDWAWTTICREGYMDCQILSPRQWEDIICANTVEDIFKCVNDIKGGKYFND